MGFQDVALLPSRAGFSTTFFINCGEVLVSGPPHVLRLWLGVSKGIKLPVRYYVLTNTLLCQSSFMEKTILS